MSLVKYAKNVASECGNLANERCLRYMWVEWM